jgi:hypothetical protein
MPDRVYSAARMRDAENSTDPPSGERLWPWCPAFAVLFVFHATLAVQLIGTTHQWRRLLNDDPVTSGRHALHLQQSRDPLGGEPTAAGPGGFDPSDYAGYPRTSIFDAEARPAALVQQIAGHWAGPAAYKIGLVLLVSAMPFAAWAAALVMNAGRGGGLAAATMGVLITWTRPVADLIEKGDLSVLLVAALAALALASFVRWNRSSGFLGWCGVLSFHALGWSAHPGYWLVVQSAQTLFWARVARRRGWRWNLATGSASVAAIAASYPIWGEWLLGWWVRLRDGPAASALAWQHLAVVGLWLSVLPTAVVVPPALRKLLAGPHTGFAVGSIAFLFAAGLLVGYPSLSRLRWWWGPMPLRLGMPVEAVRLESAIRAATSADARVLFEDLSRRPDLGWTPLLPSRTGRPFIGGLDTDGVLEHAACALRDGALAGRPINFWSDPELDGYVRRYNVGCVVCRSRECGDRFARWPAAERVPLMDGDGWQVFVVRRPHTFALKGSATRVEADGRRITMADVVPEDGEVVLSLHYHDGWRARPSWVRVERELDPYDPIPLVRLRVPVRVGRVTLTWDGR